MANASGIIPGVFVAVAMVALFAVGLIVEGLLALRGRWMRRQRAAKDLPREPEPSRLPWW
ncbi:MAG TPA: hypothetical protein VIY49_17190 [Bryobacteraceae bacterium]